MGAGTRGRKRWPSAEVSVGIGRADATYLCCEEHKREGVAVDGVSMPGAVSGGDSLDRHGGVLLARAQWPTWSTST